MEHLSSRTQFFQILTAEMPQPQLYSLSRDRLLGRIGVAFELVSDGSTDEVGAVGVEPFLNHQVDVAEIDGPEVDCDLLAVRDPFRHFTIYMPSNWMAYARQKGPFQGAG